MADENKRQCAIQIPDELLKKLKELPGGVKSVLDKVEKEYGLTTSTSGKHTYIAGPSPEILQLAIETLQRRFLDNDTQDSTDSGIINELEDKRAVWKFFGEYARKASHLFLTELKELQRVDSVIVKETRNCLEITCSYDDTDVVKDVMHKLEHDLHELYEQDVKLTGNRFEIKRIRSYIKHKHKFDKTVLMTLNEDGTTVKVCGKHKAHVDKIVDELKTGKASGTLVLPLVVSKPLKFY